MDVTTDRAIAHWIERSVSFWTARALQQPPVKTGGESENEGHVTWNKRLSDEDVAALRADMRAGFAAAKIHGVRFPMSRLIELTKLSGSFVGNVYHGKRKTTLPTSQTIRDALRKMLDEAPGGDATPRANAIASAEAAEAQQKTQQLDGRNNRRGKKMPESFKQRIRAKYDEDQKMQAPLRARVKAYCAENDITRRAFSRRVGGMTESAISYFLSGKLLRPANLERVRRYLDKHSPADDALIEPKRRGRPPKSAALVHRPEQQPLPFPQTNGLLAVAAAMHPLHRSTLPTSGETRSAGEIARAFLAQKLGGELGIEAIEALLLIAKTT